MGNFLTVFVYNEFFLMIYYQMMLGTKVMTRIAPCMRTPAILQNIRVLWGPCPSHPHVLAGPKIKNSSLSKLRLNFDLLTLASSNEGLLFLSVRRTHKHGKKMENHGR